MIYKIKTKSETEELYDKLPLPVITEIKRVANILDEYYNSQGIDGGYILIAETKSDLETVKSKYLDYINEIYELKDYIYDWVSMLYLTGTEYSITLITPKSNMD